MCFCWERVHNYAPPWHPYANPDLAYVTDMGNTVRKPWWEIFALVGSPVVPGSADDYNINVRLLNRTDGSYTDGTTPLSSINFSPVEAGDPMERPPSPFFRWEHWCYMNNVHRVVRARRVMLNLWPLLPPSLTVRVESITTVLNTDHIIYYDWMIQPELRVPLSQLLQRRVQSLKQLGLHKTTCWCHQCCNAIQQAAADLLIDLQQKTIPGERQMCFNCGLVRQGSVWQKCSCKTVSYCSETCQKQHWPTHRPFCSSRRSEH